MSQQTVCDVCGATTDQENNAFYNVSRYMDDCSEIADVCLECLPDKINEALIVEEHGDPMDIGL